MNPNKATRQPVWQFESRLQRLTELSRIAQTVTWKLDARHETCDKLNDYKQLICQLASKTDRIRKMPPDRQYENMLKSRRQLIVWDLLIQQMEMLIEQHQDRN